MLLVKHPGTSSWRRQSTVSPGTGMYRPWQPRPRTGCRCIRTRGNINARTVAKNLKCSTQPVMYQFETIEELKKAVYAKADRFHTEYRLLEKYGLCKSSVSARRFCYYVPLIILATNNLWNGVTVNCSWFEMVCHICLMLCVGFQSLL